MRKAWDVLYGWIASAIIGMPGHGNPENPTLEPSKRASGITYQLARELREAGILDVAIPKEYVETFEKEDLLDAEKTQRILDSRYKDLEENEKGTPTEGFGEDGLLRRTYKPKPYDENYTPTTRYELVTKMNTHTAATQGIQARYDKKLAELTKGK